MSEAAAGPGEKALQMAWDSESDDSNGGIASWNFFLPRRVTVKKRKKSYAQHRCQWNRRGSAFKARGAVAGLWAHPRDWDARPWSRTSTWVWEETEMAQQVSLSSLQESEREVILQVLYRDQEVQNTEAERIRSAVVQMAEFFAFFGLFCLEAISPWRLAAWLASAVCSAFSLLSDKSPKQGLWVEVTFTVSLSFGMVRERMPSFHLKQCLCVISWLAGCLSICLLCGNHSRAALRLPIHPCKGKASS